MNKLLIAIVGPTAIGKTSLSIKLAKHFNAEIFSADSRQFFKEMKIGQVRPNMSFLQGNYTLTHTTDTVIDTVINNQHTVISYQIFPMTGTNKSDSIGSTTNYYWKAGYEYVIDTNGSKVDSVVEWNRIFSDFDNCIV